MACTVRSLASSFRTYGAEGLAYTAYPGFHPGLFSHHPSGTVGGKR